jgi:hypothetical protein
MRAVLNFVDSSVAKVRWYEPVFHAEGVVHYSKINKSLYHGKVDGEDNKQERQEAEEGDRKKRTR